MPQTCKVKTCKAKKDLTGNSVGFLTFPKDPEKRKQWLSSVKLLPKDVKNRTFICTQHFHPSTLRHDEAGRWYLMDKSAIPTEKTYNRRKEEYKMKRENRLKQRLNDVEKKARQAQIDKSLSNYINDFADFQRDLRSRIDEEFWQIKERHDRIILTHNAFDPDSETDFIDRRVAVNDKMKLISRYFERNGENSKISLRLVKWSQFEEILRSPVAPQLNYQTNLSTPDVVEIKSEVLVKIEEDE